MVQPPQCYRGQATKAIARRAKDGCTTIFSIDFIADLNNDGVMEIVICDRYYEGTGYAVLEIKYGKTKEVLNNGWGL